MVCRLNISRSGENVHEVPMPGDDEFLHAITRNIAIVGNKTSAIAVL
jgi:hypothetical protein